VLVDSYGSPTITSDLATFDQANNLPAPPSFRIIQPAGAVPPYDPNNYDMGNWGFETSLDVEYAHSMAPGANILLVETPVDETLGVQGFPQMIEAENYVINRHLGDVISQSFGATEQTFPSKFSILSLRSAYFNALVHRVTVLSASGDGGATDDSAYDPSNGDVNYYRSGLTAGRPATRSSLRSAARSSTSTQTATVRRPTTCGTTPRCSAAPRREAVASPRCSADRSSRTASAGPSAAHAATPTSR
jgi:hypothetical protein